MVFTKIQRVNKFQLERVGEFIQPSILFVLTHEQVYQNPPKSGPTIPASTNSACVMSNFHFNFQNCTTVQIVISPSAAEVLSELNYSATVSGVQGTYNYVANMVSQIQLILRRPGGIQPAWISH